MIQISYYSIFYVIGMIVSSLIIILLSKVHQLNKMNLFCCMPYFAMGTFIGAKVFYIMENLNHFTLNANFIFGSGFSFTGSILGGIAAILLYCRLLQIEQNDYLSVFSTAFPCIYFFGKLGCCLIGCCESIFDIPLQLIEASISLLIFAYLTAIYMKKTNNMIYKYLMLYGITRFLSDYLRELRNPIFFNLSLTLTQLTCFIFLMLSVIMLTKTNLFLSYYSKKDHKLAP